MMLRVFNYNTLEKVSFMSLSTYIILFLLTCFECDGVIGSFICQVHGFEAHSDYLRAIAVHPTQPYALTCSGKWKKKFIFRTK